MNSSRGAETPASHRYRHLFAFFTLLLVFLSFLIFGLFWSPPVSSGVSSSFRFLSLEVLTLTTVEVPRPVLVIWLSATVQSAEFVSIAYLQRNREGREEGDKESNCQPTHCLRAVWALSS